MPLLATNPGDATDANNLLKSISRYVESLRQSSSDERQSSWCQSGLAATKLLRRLRESNSIVSLIRDVYRSMVSQRKPTAGNM